MTRRDRRVWLYVAGLFVLCTAPLWLMPTLYALQTPRFQRFDDTSLLSQRFEPQIALDLCRISLVHQQQLSTTVTREELWERLPEGWSNRDGTLSSYFDQVHFQQEYYGTVRIRSWIHYDSAAVGDTPVNISNGLTLRVC